jgi:hypothetical protein
MAQTHKFKRSVSYNSRKGCPSGYHPRKSYTVKKTGTYVPARCVKSQSPYAETSKQFKARTARKQTARLRRAHKPKNTTRKCPPGQIARKGYIRRFSSGIKATGYTVKRKSGRSYRVYPKKKSTYVKSSCVKDRGLKGKAAPGEQIGPLRKGELKKYGYVYRLPTDQRHSALRKAVSAYGPLSVYRKLNAVAKLAVRTAPDASRAFKADRNWIRETYGPLKAF